MTHIHPTDLTTPGRVRLRTERRTTRQIMIIYGCYVEDVTLDPLAVERGFIAPENKTSIYYRYWIL